MEIEFEAEIGKNFKPNTKTVNLIIHNIETEPKTVKLNNKKQKSNWDSFTKQLTIPVKWNTRKEIELKIKLVCSYFRV